MRILRAILVFTLASVCSADIITMRNGRVINGIYLGGSASQMQVQVGDNIETVNVADVARIEFRGSEPVARDSSRPTLRRGTTNTDTGDYGPSISRQADDGRPTLRRGTTNTETGDSGPSISRPADDGRPTLRRADSATPPDSQNAAPGAAGNTTPAPATQAAAAPIEVPANTNFFIRTIETIDSEKAKPGQTFAASLDRNIVINGSVVIPMGSDAVLKIVDEKQAGRVTGKTTLTLALYQVKVRGKLVEINTQNVERETASRTGKTAKAAGVGAAVGALAGVALGGGKGAAIGAGAGAGAGTAAAAMTHGEHIKIPAESLLTFTLDAPVTI